MLALDSFWRDANFVPIKGHGLVATKTLTFTGSSATVATPIFTITGTIELLKIWGVVTVVFGANHTDAHMRINDQSNTDQVLSKTTTLDLNAISVGASIIKNGLAAAVLQYKTADVGSILEPAVANEKNFSPVIIQQITAGIQTDIEYVYTTSDIPTSGAMQFFAGWLPLSENGRLSSS